MKILIVDIETAPSIAYIWQVWKANVGFKQVLERGYLMSYAAKWLDSDDVMYNENRHGDDKGLVEDLIKLFDEADVVVAHNADKFDIPTVNARAVLHKIKPPSPYKTVDTLKVAKANFRFERNTLQYVAHHLGVAEKEEHANFPGFELWLQCLKQNDEAWQEMQEYNIQDVLTLQEVYLRLRPWMRNPPNHGVHSDVPVCPACGSKRLHKRGTYSTNLSTFQRYKCLEDDCGKWSRGRKNLRPKEDMANTVIGV